ncbi:hypothetical protein [Mesorhizobium sp. M0208]|uniref:hypothetical protein n=1 Tax=unclassified Mesorhizobium TaxID=325217 RepID=UPI0033389DE9
MTIIVSSGKMPESDRSTVRGGETLAPAGQERHLLTLMARFETCRSRYDLMRPFFAPSA